MKTCYWCKEPIEDNEMWVLVGDRVAHENCNLRSVIGSVAHIEKRCSCFVPGSTEGDPEGMTRREAANAAREAYERQYDGPGEEDGPWAKGWKERKGNKSTGQVIDRRDGGVNGKKIPG